MTERKTTTKRVLVVVVVVVVVGSSWPSSSPLPSPRIIYETCNTCSAITSTYIAAHCSACSACSFHHSVYQRSYGTANQRENGNGQIECHPIYAAFGIQAVGLVTLVSVLYRDGGLKRCITALPETKSPSAASARHHRLESQSHRERKRSTPYRSIVDSPSLLHKVPIKVPIES